jgi:predicted dinucleotide-binding enzyme
MPPSLFVSNTDSLGEQIQRAFPAAKVVKALNTMNCEVMVDPGKVPRRARRLPLRGLDAARSIV